MREADLNNAAGGEPRDWIGSLAIVELSVPDLPEPVLLAHHKPTWQSDCERVREQQTVASASVIEAVLSDAHRRLILAGDFDATPDAASVRFWTGRQSLDGLSVYYQDAWDAIHPDEPGHTFTPRNIKLVSDARRPRPGRRIDYVFVRCGSKGAALDITACDLAFAEPVDGTWASDHFGVVAYLTPTAPSTDSSRPTAGDALRRRNPKTCPLRAHLNPCVEHLGHRPSVVRGGALCATGV